MSPVNAASNPNDQMRVEHHYGRDRPPSIAIVEAIAVIENVDPMNFQARLGFRLYDQIDPEALNHLVTNNSDSATVTIGLTLQADQQYTVQIHDNGQLIVQKTH